jgi:multidrug transporter EmrE-like cation transporter
MTRTLFYIILYAACNVSGAALIKYQLQGSKLTAWKEWLKLLFDSNFIFAFILVILSALALFKALSTNQFSLVIPIATGINFILTTAVGYFLFQDRLSMLSYIGFLLIISGVFILSLNNHVHAK